jgi:hypothetical protein
MNKKEIYGKNSGRRIRVWIMRIKKLKRKNIKRKMNLNLM